MSIADSVKHFVHYYRRPISVASAMLCMAAVAYILTGGGTDQAGQAPNLSDTQKREYLERVAASASTAPSSTRKTMIDAVSASRESDATGAEEKLRIVNSLHDQ